MPEITTNAPATPKVPASTSSRALWAGIVFSFLFTALIAWAGERLNSIPLLPDTGVAWYYWRLPEPTFWTRLTAWGFYLAHQFTFWGLIWYAQKNQLKYTGGLHKVNILALAANAFFILLHFVQTHIWYDGLAQDVSIFTSQGSVIVMLVWILLMENSRRGLFFGKKMPLGKAVMAFARKYHGYLFAWAAVYTFWYHPMVNTSGHLIGFLYMFFLLLQGSLFFTRVHLNRWWTFAQEGMVAVHGTLVAVQQGTGIWTMFFFGFTGIFVITQMYGLPLKAWMRWIILGAYIAAALGVYSQVGWARLNEIIRIPFIEYLGVGILALIFAGGLWVGRKLSGRQGSSIQPTAAD